MTRKILKITILSIVGLFLTVILLLLLASLYLFKSQGGRGFIKTQLENQIAKQTGGTATISEIETGLPHYIVLKNINIDDDNDPSTKPLLTAKEIKIIWHPSMLLKKHIDIDSIVVDHLTLNHLPTQKQEKATNDNIRFMPPSLDKALLSLPHTNVNSLSINHLAISPKILKQNEIDQLIIFNATGKAKTNKGELILDLQGQTDGLKDSIKISTNINLNDNIFEGDAKIISSQNGIFAQLTETNDSLDITLKGSRLDNDTTIAAHIDAGSLGIVQATLSEGKNVASPRKTHMRLEGSLQPGEQLNALKKNLGDTIDFSISNLTQKKGTQLQIHHITANPGTLAGTIEWQDNSNVLKDIHLQVEHVFDVNFQPALQESLGNKIAFSTHIIQENPNDYAVTIDANTPTMQLFVSDAQTDLDQNFTGNIKAIFKQREHAPQIQSLTQGAAVDFTGQLKVSNATIITIEEGKLRVGDQSIATMAMTHNVQSNQVNGQLSTSLPSAFLSRINPILKAQNDLTSIMTFSGSPDDLKIALEADTPIISINDQLIPASHIVSAFKGLPSNSTGRFTATTQNDDDLLDFSIAQTEEKISVQNIIYKSTSFALEGNADFAPSQDSLTLDLAYQGARSAKPLPALSLYGGFSLKGSLSTTSVENPLHLKSQNLGSDNIVLRDLDFIAEGSFTNLSMKTKLGALRREGINILSNLSLQNQLTIGETIDVAINQFSGKILEDNFFETKTVANLSFGETFSAENINIAYGPQGSIALDANFKPSHWQMELTGENIALTQTGTSASLTMSLDTNRVYEETSPTISRSAIAEGLFSINKETIAPTPTTPQEKFIQGAFAWDSEKIHAYHTSPKNDDFLKFDINVPARLIKSDTQASPLSLDTNGALSGNIEIDGRIEKIVTFLTNFNAQPSPIEGLEGLVNGVVNISGTVPNPEFTINGTLKDAAFTDPQSGLSLIGLHADITTTPSPSGNTLIFSAGGRGATQEGTDRFTIEGNVFLGETSTVKTDVSFKDLELSAGPLETLRTTGLVNIAGPLNAINAKGDINIDRMDVAIIPQPQTGLVNIEVITQSDIAENSAHLSNTAKPKKEPVEPAVLYDIAINADDKIFIRGRGLESEWTSNLTVKNEGTENITLGNITLRRGTFDFSGRRFDVNQGEIIFDQLAVNDPVITINAEYDTGNDIVARVTASGRASDMKVELTSTPTRPPNDVMALILFGKPSEDLSAIESVQTAQALASLGGIGPFGGGGVFNSLRQSTGLDLLNIDLDPTGGASSLTVGKYIADGLFVSASQDIKGQNGTVRVEYEVRKNITLESNIRQDGNQSVSANWKKDF